MMKKILLLFFTFISCISFGQARPHWKQIVERQYSDVADITQFGAIANTNTSAAKLANYNAFVSAVAWLESNNPNSLDLYETKANGGTLYIPAGNYYMDTTISIKDVRGLKIVGAGKRASIIQSTANPILKFDNTISGHMTYGQHTVQDVGFANPIQFAISTRSFDPLQVGIYTKLTFGNVWNNLEFNNIGKAIYLDTSYLNTIMGCMFRLGVGVSGTGANHNQISGCWFADSIFDLSGVPGSSLFKCDVESGGFLPSTGPVVGTDCQIFNNRFERVNINASMSYLVVSGNRASIYDNQFHLTVAEIDKLSRDKPVIKISGNNNRVTIPYISFTRRVFSLEPGAQNNTIRLESPLAGSGQNYTILKSLPYHEVERHPDSNKNTIVYASVSGQAETKLFSTFQDTQGVFTELGSSNGKLANNTYWFPKDCTRTPLDPASYPFGWSTDVASFVTITALTSPSTELKRWYMTNAKTVADNQPVTAVALIKNDSDVGAHFGLRLARGEYIPPNSDWQWYVTRAVGSGIADIRVCVTLADALDSDYWTTASQSLSIGAISIVEGEIPAYVGLTGETLTSFIGKDLP